jgi:hypothetical protein
VGTGFRWRNVGFGAAAVLWPVAAAAGALAKRSPGESSAYLAGRVLGAILGALFVAVLLRFVYLKLFRRGHEGAVRSPWLFVLALLFSWIFMLGVDNDARASADDCARDFPAGFLSAVPPEQARFISVDELRRASHALCDELVASDADVQTDAELRELLSSTIREQPQLFRPICNVLVDAEFESIGPLLDYVSKKDRARYRSRACAYTVEYMHDDGTVNLAEILADHPLIYSPFCAAGMMSELEGDALLRKSLTKRQLRRIARRTCDEAIRTGVVNLSTPGGLVSPQVDQGRLVRILERNMLEVARG